MKKILNTKFWILITAIAFIMVNTSIYASNEPNPYDNGDLSLYQVKTLYHTKINDIFNTSTQLLQKGETGGGTNKIPDGDNCEEKNYSTFCVAMKVSNEYDLYAKALKKRQTTIKVEDTSIVTISEVASKIAAQSNAIEIELNSAAGALDTTLATYNDLALYYAMHLEYEKIIKSLTKYNDKLAELRKVIELYPGKFVDATTPQCT